MRKVIITACVCWFATTASFAAAWQPVAGTMTTKWTAEVDPRCPLPEYPRPQMVRAQWENLNGLWKYAVTAKSKTSSEINDGEILVPFAIESALSGVKRTFKPSEKLWYERSFEVPAKWREGKVLLHFGAVDYYTTVYVNGKKAGDHEGCGDAFTFDITGLLVPGETQQVSLEVTDPTDEGKQPRGKQVLKPHGIYYTAVSGIWKTVWIEPVPEKYISDFASAPDIDRGIFTINARVTGGDGATMVRYTALDGGKQIATATAKPGENAVLNIPNAKLWCPDSPFLYDLKIEVLHSGKVVDSVGSYFGMRKIAVAKDARGINRIMLNNKVMFQYGFLDQGWWPDGLLTAPTDEALQSDIIFTKNAGYNTIRKHIKIEPDRFYYHCDKLGMIVWQDAVSGDDYNLKNSPKGLEKDPTAARQFEHGLKAMIDQLRNHPCIVNWVVFNEGWGQYGGRKWIDWTKQYDTTRLAEVTGWVDMGNGDICDTHRYPAPGRVENPGPDRAFVVGEFGGLGLPIKGHLWNPDMDNWGYATYTDPQAFKEAYEHLVFHLRTMIDGGLSAAIYTQTTDVEGEVNGMLTYDRAKEKIPSGELAAINKLLYTSPIDLTILMPNSERTPQQWRYTTAKPQGEWTAVGYDDSSWKQGPGMFGYNHPAWQLGYAYDERTDPAHIPGTEWRTDEIWLRRDFTLDKLPTDPYLQVRYDEYAQVYVNGVLVAEVSNRPAHYSHSDLVRIAADKLSAFRKGENTIAVYCKRNKEPKGPANQSIDVAIVDAGKQ